MSTQQNIDAYWAKVKTLPVFEQRGAASDGYRTLLVVDWSSVFAGTTRDSASFVLGFDPVTREWIDEQAQYSTMSQWLSKGLDELDKRVKALEDWRDRA